MMKHNSLIYIVIAMALLLTACKGQPDYVIEEDRMVDLLVDIHKTEAVINLNYSHFNSNEKKRGVREAVYMRHNTNKAQFDTSLVWYGNHLDVYMDVYDRVIAKLKEEDSYIKELIAQDDVQILTLEGDTIDIWKQERWHFFNSNKGENVLSFSIDKDENFKRRDHFTLRFHTINVPTTGNKVHAYIATRHNNQLINYNYATVKEGWNTIKTQSDSLNNLNEIYGYIAMPPRNDGHIMYIDSIELIRIHNTPEMDNEEYNAIIIENKKSRKKAPEYNLRDRGNKERNKSFPQREIVKKNNEIIKKLPDNDE